MTKELETKILELISGAEGDLPGLAQDYLAWNMSVNIIQFSVCFVFVCVFLGLWAKYKSLEGLMDCSNLAISMAAGCCLVVGLLGMSITASEMYKIKSAPTIYLLDIARGR